MKGDSLGLTLGLIIGIYLCHIAPKAHHSYYDPIAALKYTFLGFLLIIGSIGFLAFLIRVKGLLGWVPLAIALTALIALFVMGVCLLAYNLPYIFPLS